MSKFSNMRDDIKGDELGTMVRTLLDLPDAVTKYIVGAFISHYLTLLADETSNCGKECTEIVTKALKEYQQAAGIEIVEMMSTGGISERLKDCLLLIERWGEEHAATQLNKAISDMCAFVKGERESVWAGTVAVYAFDVYFSRMAGNAATPGQMAIYNTALQGVAQAYAMNMKHSENSQILKKNQLFGVDDSKKIH